MLRSRTRRAVIFAWSDLILDRSRKLVGLQSPAACAKRAGGDSDPNFENYDLFHAQFQDTGRGVYALLCRANRDVDVRRKFLGFCFRVYLLALLLDGPYGGEKSAEAISRAGSSEQVVQLPGPKCAFIINPALNSRDTPTATRTPPTRNKT